MKRFTVAVLFLIAVAAVAADRKLELLEAPAEGRTFEVEGAKITVRQADGLVHVAVVEPDGTKSEYQIPPRKRVVIAGLSIDTFEKPARIEPLPRPRMDRELAGGWIFVCPKDEAMLRVKQDPRGKTYRCPVDGQHMVQGRGPSSMFFYVD